MDAFIRISLDAMGGDHGLSVVVPAALEALNKHDDIILTLVGDEQQVLAQLANCGAEPHERLCVHHASQQVEMGEPPALALRNKKDSSMRVAINLIKEKKADAMVSAGNTGALMATARFVLKCCRVLIARQSVPLCRPQRGTPTYWILAPMLIARQYTSTSLL